MDEEILEGVDDADAAARYTRAEKRKNRAIVSFVLLGVSILVAVLTVLLETELIGTVPKDGIEGGLEAFAAVLVYMFIGFAALIGAALTFVCNVIGFTCAMAALSVRPVGLRIAVIVAGVLHGLILTAILCGVIVPVLMILLRAGAV